MTKEIPLSRGLVALVDDEDFDWLSQWKWCANSSGFIGVYFCRSNRAFQASVKVNGIPHYAGSFPTAEEAARARDAKALVLHGSFARLNFPIDGA